MAPASTPSISCARSCRRYCRISAGRCHRQQRHHRKRGRWRQHPLAFPTSASALLAAVGFGGLFAAMKVECGTIHAVAQPGGLRAVVKDMAEVAAALTAMDFGTSHKNAAVGLRLDSLVDRRPEA